MQGKIPTAIIGLLSKIIPKYYTHTEIDSLFLGASAPGSVPDGNKSVKVQTWLCEINKKCLDPLENLGSVIADFMDDEELLGIDNDTTSSRKEKNSAREKIRETLAKDGLGYLRGGLITKGASIPTQSLEENVAKNGLSAVDIEIKRALVNVEKDPLAAVHAAGSVLESAVKAYLDHDKVPYKDGGETLSVLWKKVVEHARINPRELGDPNLKRIASGLFNIVEGTMHLRNDAAHGQSEERLQKNNIRPRHARLAIHAAHTISAYILELRA